MAQPHIETTEAFASAPASTEKTALIAAADAFLDALEDAATAEAFPVSVQVALQDDLLDLCKNVAANLVQHSGD